MGILFAVYLTSMAVAMYPGRDAIPFDERYEWD
jgi:hypothetical protein